MATHWLVLDSFDKTDFKYAVVHWLQYIGGIKKPILWACVSEVTGFNHILARECFALFQRELNKI